jgi:hypothetical protein
MAGEMPAVQVCIRQNNDVTLTAYLTDPSLPLVGGKQQPLDLSGRTVTFIRKVSRDVPDTDPSFKSYTGNNQSPNSAGITKFSIPRADNAVANVTWHRIDVTSAGLTVTAEMGPLSVDPT